MKAIFCSILVLQSYDFWANGDLRKPYNKPASLSQITSILQLFIKQTSICHDNLLVLQLNIKKGSNNISGPSVTLPERLMLLFVSGILPSVSSSIH